jgi:hypothetical protein
MPQLPASDSNISQGLNHSSPLTNSPTNSTPLTPRLVAISHQPLTLLIAISRLLDSAVMTAGPHYITSTRIAQRTLPPIALPLLHLCLLRPLPSNICCLQSHYLAAADVQLLISWSLPTNGSTCHTMISAYHKDEMHMATSK